MGKCSEDVQRILISEAVTFAEAESKVIEPYLNIKEDDKLTDEAKKAALEKIGLVDGWWTDGGWMLDGAYGVAKAAVNAYTIELARRYPSLYVNACTPGFIATDLTKSYAEKAGKSPAEMGMKTPEEGATAAVKLTMQALAREESGRFYGSDALRSPLHKYRSPGAPEYDGSFP